MRSTALPLRVRSLLALLGLIACDGSHADHETDAGPLYAQATAELSQVRPRQTIDPNMPDMAMANDPNAVTSWWPITGTATFKSTAEGIDLAVNIENCRGPYLYPVSVYDGASCSDLQTASPTWDGARGALMATAFCLGAPGARLYYTRLSSDAKPWTLGGSAKSNLVGRLVAVLDPDTREPLACGKIELPDGGSPVQPISPAQQPSATVAAEAVGGCLLSRGAAARDGGAPCPDPMKLGKCALIHCLDVCLQPCAEYIDCLESHAMCSGQCVQADACSKCLDGAQCALGHCRKELSCAPPPSPNGPCTEFRACCMRQGPLVAACLDYAAQLEDLSGDVSCAGALVDWDVQTNFTYRSPCYPDGGAPPSE